MPNAVDYATIYRRTRLVIQILCKLAIRERQVLSRDATDSWFDRWGIIDRFSKFLELLSQMILYLLKSSQVGCYCIFRIIVKPSERL
jgi:hypothetical protein